MKNLEHDKAKVTKSGLINGSGSPPIQKPPISSGFYLDEGHVADKKSNGKEQATSKVIYFSFSTSQLTTPRPPFQLRLWLRSIQRWRRNQGGQKSLLPK
jgi:hypothetical protein